MTAGLYDDGLDFVDYRVLQAVVTQLHEFVFGPPGGKFACMPKESLIEWFRSTYDFDPAAEEWRAKGLSVH